MSFWRDIYNWFRGDSKIVVQAQKVSTTPHTSSAFTGSTHITNPLKKIAKKMLAQETVTIKEELSMDKKSAEKAVTTAVDTWLTAAPHLVRVNLGDAVKARLVQGVLNALYPAKPAVPTPAAPRKDEGNKGGDGSGGPDGNPGGNSGGDGSGGNT